MLQPNFKIKIFLLFFTFLLFKDVGAQQLQVSQNGRYLVSNDEKPFFWLGDTAWELFHRLDRNDADVYLEDRAAKGFTVIQAVILAELNGLETPNPYGALPLIGQDPEKPNERYFKHVDYIIKKANALGMYVALLPTWGDKFNKKWGVGPEIFNAKNALKFGEYLADRYKKDAVVWILGGDRNPENEEDYAIIRAMAAGLESVHQGAQLMTYHPQGGQNSGTLFPEDEWLDFHFYQSGHTNNNPNYRFNKSNIQLFPSKPTIDGEPRYEDHPVDFNPQSGWFDSFDVRKAAYWSVLSGAAGHTYGNHNIWQMWESGRAPISWARTHWKEALNHNGATQMGFMKKLFKARPWYKLQPDQTLILGKNEEDEKYQMAAIADDRSFALIYTPYGKEISVDLNRISGAIVKAWWFNPRDGRALLHKNYTDKRVVNFKPHSPGRGSDWVLILEDENQNLEMPE